QLRGGAPGAFAVERQILGQQALRLALEPALQPRGEAVARPADEKLFAIENRLAAAARIPGDEHFAAAIAQRAAGLGRRGAWHRGKLALEPLGPGTGEDDGIARGAPLRQRHTYLAAVGSEA